jgi:hypothetical protein
MLPTNHVNNPTFDAQAAEARLTTYCESTYCESLPPDAVICSEFGTRLGNADLIAAILECEEITQAEWDARSELDKRKSQVCFVAPPFCLF